MARNSSNLRSKPAPRTSPRSTAPGAFLAVKDAVAAAGIAIASDELAFLPENEIEIAGADAAKSLALLSALDDHDDVQNVSVNFQIPDEVAASG